jgi:LysM repeat protein
MGTDSRPQRAVSLVALLAVLAAGGFAAPATHTVLVGDTLSSIGRRYGVSVAALVQRNGLRDPDQIVVGTRLAIPTTGRATAATPTPAPTASPQTHTVRAGETLSMIADRYAVALPALRSANGLRNADRILVGAQLRIPDSAATATGTTTGSTGSGTDAPPVPQRTLAQIPTVPVPPLLTLTYVIQPGDSVNAVARTYGIPKATLVEANDLGDPNRIIVGGHLLIPGVPGDVVRLPSFVQPARRTWATVFAQAAKDFGVPVELAMAVGHMESGWQNSVVSSVGARGMMQLTDETVDFVSLTLLGRATPLDPGDPVQNIRMGVRFLAYLLDQTGGDVDQALAGYNQGLLSVRQHGLYDDTRLFVAGVLALRDRFAEARRG